jgi:ribosomal protein L11 methyltransferase
VHTISFVPSPDQRLQVQVALECQGIPYQEVLPPQPGHIVIGRPGSLILYADDAAQAERYLQVVREAGVEDIHVDVSPFSSRDWVERWKIFYEWVPVSPRLAVGPPFKVCPFPVHHQVIIEPGQGFGTGTHESTRIALGFLDSFIAPGMTVLDAGCGSGILSIAARKLAAEAAFGFDIDPESVQESLENAQRNHTDIRVALGSIETVTSQYDLVVANMLSFRLLPLARGLQEAVCDGGILVLAGLLDEDLPDFLHRFLGTPTAFVPLERRHQNDWWGVALRKERP